MLSRALLILAFVFGLSTESWSVDLATLRGHAAGRSLALDGDTKGAQDAWDRLLHGNRGDIHALPIAHACSQRELEDALDQFRTLAPVWVAGGEGDCHVLLWGAFSSDLEARSMSSALPSSLSGAAAVLLTPPLAEMRIATHAMTPAPATTVARKDSPKKPRATIARKRPDERTQPERSAEPRATDQPPKPRAKRPEPTPAPKPTTQPPEPKRTAQPPEPKRTAQPPAPKPTAQPPEPKRTVQPPEPRRTAQPPARKPEPATQPKTTPAPTKPRVEPAPSRSTAPVATGKKLAPTPSPYPSAVTEPPVPPPAELYAELDDDQRASYLFRDGNAAWTRQEFPVAIGFFEAALAIEPDNSRTLNNLGTAWLRHGSPADAEKALRRAIAVNPDYARAHLNLSTALYAQNRAAEAREHLHRVIELEPSNIDAYYNLAAVMAEDGLWAEAKGVLESGLKVSQGHAGLLELLEDVDRQLRAQNSEASPCEVQAASESLRLRKALSRFEAGVQAIRRGSYGDAIFELEASLACDPTHPETANQLGTARRAMGDINGARGAYELAAQHGSLEGKANLALLLKEAGDCDGAITTLQELTTAAPEFANGWYFLGAVLYKCGRPSDAEAAVLSGLEAIPGDPSLQKLLDTLRESRIGPGN